jgi:hypothetical protein
MNVNMSGNMKSNGPGTLKPTNRVNLLIRYSECDAQQLVFNARYAEYANQSG